MNTKLCLLGLLAMGPAVAFGQAAPVTPAVAPLVPATAAPVAPTAPVAAAPTAVPAKVDASRVQDCGPLHIQIKRVDIQGNNYFITGELVSSEKTPLKLYSTSWRWNAGGATSLGGDPGLRCDSVTLGDAPDHGVPTISVEPNTAYSFSVEIVTADGAPNGLQELRIATETKEGRKVATFPKLMPDPANTSAINAPAAAAGSSAASGTTPAAADPSASGVTPATPVDVGGLTPPAAGAATALGSPGATGATGANGATGTTPAAGAAGKAVAAPVGKTAAVTAQPTAAPPSNADTVAEADINALQAAINAKQWNVAQQEIGALQAVEKNGANKTQLSTAGKTAVDSWIRVGGADITLGKLNPPKTFDDYVNRAKIEMNAGMFSQSQQDLNSANGVPKINAGQKKEIAQLEAQLAKLSGK